MVAYLVLYVSICPCDDFVTCLGCPLPLTQGLLDRHQLPRDLEKKIPTKEKAKTFLHIKSNDS